jgi:hypothetical protein
MALCESIFYGIPYVELFCETIYQHGSSSTDRAVHGAEALKNGFTGEVEPC